MSETVCTDRGVLDKDHGASDW